MSTVITVLLNILFGLLFLSIIMIVHELGHYIAGRLLKFKILEFSLFMGPVLFERKVNGIKYNIKLLPIGASVSFANEYPDTDTPEEKLAKATNKPKDSDNLDEVEFDPNDPGCFNNRPRWARAIVVVMGPLVNIVMAVLCFFALFAIKGVEVPTVAQVLPNSKAAIVGVEAGDKIVSLGGKSINTAYDYMLVGRLGSLANRQITVKDKNNELKTYAFNATQKIKQLGIKMKDDNGAYVITDVDERNKSKEAFQVGDTIVAVEGESIANNGRVSELLQTKETIKVQIKRNNQPMEVVAKALLIEQEIPDGVIFVTSYALGDIASQALLSPWSIAKGTVSALGNIFKGKMSAKENLSGPVGIVSMVGGVATAEGIPISMRLLTLLTLMAIISVAVGFTNLLPIPPFDGFQLTVFGIEGIIRRDLPQKLKGALAILGFVLIIGLAVTVTVFDVMRLFG